MSLRTLPGIYIRNSHIVRDGDALEPHHVELIHWLLDYAATKGVSDERVAEYVNEAHHQDGVEYWDNFLDTEELFSDFDMYVDTLGDDIDGDVGYCADC